MARKFSLVDDMDSSEGAEERTFSIGGVNYLIDLNDENYARFLLAIEPWRSRARVERRGSFRLTPTERVRVREWAQSNDMPLNDRGRFPHSVIQAYFDSVDGDDQLGA